MRESRVMKEADKDARKAMDDNIINIKISTNNYKAIIKQHSIQDLLII